MASVETRHSAAMALPTVMVIFRSMCLLLILSFVPTTILRELPPERSKFHANKHGHKAELLLTCIRVLSKHRCATKREMEQGVL